ncbi:MAG: 5'/3'-nucleotidase SurE [Christensenellaceae bacterium]|nr:5'/3'-nucleotidase SurE [Christensenellaceae bacterium]
MNILLVNDDGFFSDGITKLAKALILCGHNVVEVAPDRCCSGMGHAETFNKEIKVYRRREFQWECYSISGTPCDCIIVGMEIMKNRALDMIISGLNLGTNLGTEILYSGTVNAAIEAKIRGIKSIALSGRIKKSSDFDYIIQLFIENFDYYATLIEDGDAISINYHDEATGNLDHKLAFTGTLYYEDVFTVIKKEDESTYILDGIPVIDAVQNSDVTLFHEGYITVTPLSYCFTDFEKLTKLMDGQKKK